MERFINCSGIELKCIQLFNSDPTIQFIEIGTFRCCRWLVPYNPIKFYERDGLIICYEDVKYIGTDDLPLLHYYSRDMKEHSVNSIRNMFYNCSRLKRVDCSIWNLETVTDSVNVFEPRYEFIPVLLDKWPELLKNKAESTAIINDRTLTLDDYKQLFDSDPNIKYIEIRTLRKCYWDTPYNPDKFELKNGKIRCKKETITINDEDLPLLHYYDRDMNEHIVTSIEYMFFNCPSIMSIDLDGWNTETVTNMSYLFSCCDRLYDLSISNLNTANVKDMKLMFFECEGLEELDLNSWNTQNVTNMNHMFEYCPADKPDWYK